MNAGLSESRSCAWAVASAGSPPWFSIVNDTWTGLTVSPYKFAHGFLDGEVIIDSTGQAPGHADPEFSAASCTGSVLHLGQEQPTTNCKDYASMHSIHGVTPGMNATGINEVTPASVGKATCWKASGAIGYCSSAISETGSCTCN